jgi:hypothetical protein
MRASVLVDVIVIHRVPFSAAHSSISASCACTVSLVGSPIAAAAMYPRAASVRKWLVTCASSGDTANICPLSVNFAQQLGITMANFWSSICVAAACSLGVIVAFGAATQAGAIPLETPTPKPIPTVDDGVVTYVGTTTRVLNDGPRDIDANHEFGVDCTTGVCLLFGYSEAFRVPRVEVVDGRASFDLPAEGSLCSDEYLWAVTTTVEFTGTTATLTEIFRGAEEVMCPDGSLHLHSERTDTTLGTLVSGNPCFITDSCAAREQATTSTPTAIAPPTTPSPLSRSVDEPGVLSELPTATVAVTAQNALWASALAVILVLLLAFPTQLLDSAAEKGSERIAQWGARFTTVAGGAGTAVTRLRAAVARATSITGWRAAAIGITAAAIISSFVDPAFGLNVASIRAFVSILVSLVLQIVAGWLLLVWVVRRTHPKATAEFEFRPMTLLIVVVAVILTRITGFEPGIIFGLVAGVGFGALVATAERARVALIGIGIAFTLSVLAWLGYSLLSLLGDDGPVVVFLSETLSSLAIVGIVALPIALLPIGGMTGHAIWIWNRWIWAGSYAVGLFGFFLILMPLPFSWQEVPLSLPVWVGLFFAYAIGAVVAWALIVRPWQKSESPDTVGREGSSTAVTDPKAEAHA